LPVNEEITREIPQKQRSFSSRARIVVVPLDFFVDRQHACVHDATLVQRSIAHTTYSTGFQRRACQDGHEKPQQALNPPFLSNRNTRRNTTTPGLATCLSRCSTAFESLHGFEIPARGNGTTLVFRSRWQSSQRAADGQANLRARLELLK